MSDGDYNLFCPLAMACDALEPRWTLLILLEMWNGSTRFNELRRGVPGISPTLLSKRLKEMEKTGLVERVHDPARDTVDYLRTPMAIELEPVIDQLGRWARRHMRAEVALRDLDPDALMWNLRRKVDASELPRRRIVVRFHFTDCTGDEALYWLIARPGADVDLCKKDPKFDVDLFVEATSRAVAAIWLGYSSWREEIARDTVFLSGDPVVERTIDRWLLECGFVEAAE
ncbi:winged helix-turn-helix transcriptional regulator [Salipiger mucosus]|uniref:Transcriptional regulator, HxlR family n=1 Tax=Salipiger mucosus DSM 16094 TaxID=1123237 RepID=S9RN46_9RHOB|nr:helix-turn-helix domain-containing protein [Salipiger mucosus]EPX79515.1 Transcriptional regulator, HxlR family [Salipiger mucosus DSM 16094]